MIFFNVDTVFWDWNGTLLNDLDCNRRGLNQLLSEFGYPQRYNVEEYREIFGFPIVDFYVRAGFDFERHPFPMLAERFMEIYNGSLFEAEAMPQAAQTLATLQAAGKRQLILSACRQDSLVRQVTERGLAAYFDTMLGLSDIYAASKVQLGLDWMRQSGIDPARCVMVGDSQHDAEVAAALGMRCILFTGGHQSRSRLEAVCDTVIDNLLQLPELLR